MALQFGLNQLKNPSPTWLKNLANGATISCLLIAAVVAPMPEGWIPVEVKVYILTITSSSGILKVIEKLTGQSETPPTQ